MKKATLVVSNYLQNNKRFNLDCRDNINDRFIKLREEFINYGYDLSTDDINKIEDSEIVIYASNMPIILPKDENIHKSYIILTESSFIRPDNYHKEKHQYFKKVFTWYDGYKYGNKYIKLNIAHKFPENINKDLSTKKKLCILISANKSTPHSKENDLYSKRVDAIRWFEKNHLEDFDLYGIGWNKLTGSKVIRVLNKIPYFAKIFMQITNKSYPSYKGMVDNKKEVMQKYKFSICYENAKDIPGYITEKIFDSFFAGCIPIYWGADNINDYIPKECFIDKRDFKSYDELYIFIKTMPNEQYIMYLNNIERYIHSEQSYQFKSEGFVKTIIKEIKDDQSNS
jgi:alpha(1,3/1,4) fucosyltransferase